LAYIDDIVLFGIVGVAAIFVIGGGLNKLKEAAGIGGEGAGGHHHKSEKDEYSKKKGKGGGYLGTPGYYTKHGHHHCKKGSSSDCVCTDGHKCTVGAHLAFYDGGIMYSY
jgi:hypothetical protein